MLLLAIAVIACPDDEIAGYHPSEIVWHLAQPEAGRWLVAGVSTPQHDLDLAQFMLLPAIARIACPGEVVVTFQAASTVSVGEGDRELLSA